MRIIIDGYNLFKTIAHTKSLSNKVLERFIKKLNVYACKKKHTIIIFFDSGPTFLQEYITSSAYLSICYAGQNTSADQTIIEYVSTYKDRPLLMVSNDNALKKSVALQGVESIKSHEFWDYVIESSYIEQSKQSLSLLHKCSTEHNPELDALMNQTIVPQYILCNNENTLSTASLSKKEKKELLLRKKL